MRAQFRGFFLRYRPGCERGPTASLAVRHLGRNLLARHLAGSVSYGLLVQPLGLFLLLAPRRPDFLAVGGCPVLRLQERLEEIYGDRQDDGGVLVDGDLAHRLEQPELQSGGALQPVSGLPESLGGLVLTLGG